MVFLMLRPFRRNRFGNGEYGHRFSRASAQRSVAANCREFRCGSRTTTQFSATPSIPLPLPLRHLISPVTLRASCYRFSLAATQVALVSASELQKTVR
jgi:hypothetical protein